MSWGTYYDYDGYLSHIGKNELWSKKDECERLIKMYWNEILAFMAMTPPVYAKSEVGTEYPWAEYLDLKLRELQDGMEEEYRLLERIEQCIEVLNEHPDKVTEG